MRVFGVTLVLIIAIPCYSQNYTRDIGFRGGVGSGLCYREFRDDESALEAILSFKDNGMRITGLKENFRPAYMEFSDNLFFGYGYGGHIGYIYTDHYNFLFNEYHIDKNKLVPIAGLDALLGIEYRIREFPFIMGLTYKPYMQFSTVQFFNLVLFDLGLTFKYRF